VSGETPIYDAICRDVGAPDDPETGDARPGTATPAEHPAPPGHAPPGPDEDPVTSDLSIPADVHPPPASDGR
jgi:hypothetical protein